MSWRIESKEIVSKGLLSDKAKSLSDLHRRRNETQGQFFTPEWVSNGIWEALRSLVDEYEYLSIMDNSIGAGGLLEGAPMNKATVYGVDIDQRCIEALARDAKRANYEMDLRVAGVEDVSARGFSIGVVNPPFSKTLQSPHLLPFDCTCFGKFGPNTSAKSHEYALEHALDAARTVAAILPMSMVDICQGNKRLHTIVELPPTSFMDEGANVKTAVFFFSKYKVDVVNRLKVKQGDSWPVLDGLDRGLNKFAENHRCKFKVHGIEQSEPVITEPVTGIKRVTLHHHNRRIVLGYECALTRAKVENAIMDSEAVSERLPKSIRYKGEGQLLLDVMLLQDNPEDQLDLLCEKIRRFGGEPIVSSTLKGYYAKLIKRHARAITPMYRMIQGGDTESYTLIAKKRTMLDPKDFNSPSVAKGQVIEARFDNGEYHLSLEGRNVSLRSDQLSRYYSIVDNGEEKNHGWKVLHEGLNKAFPEMRKMVEKGLQKNGSSHWLAEFQLDSVTEGLISPYGYIAAIEQGGGKSRMSIAMCLYAMGRNMLAVESSLIPEMIRELELLGIPNNLWKVVSRNGDEPDRKLNIVSYSTLKAGSTFEYRAKKNKHSDEFIFKKKTVRTNAKRWRNRINLLICDEGGLLSNEKTQQSVAVRALSARKLVIMDGTPLRGFPRHLLPLCNASAGDSVAHQIYGKGEKPAIEKRNIVSMTQCHRGTDKFSDNHVVTKWVTNKFKDDYTGARREVPRTKNLSLFRTWLAPNIQRRLRSEPDLAQFNQCPEPVHKTHSIEWDARHFDHYYTVATKFVDWYRRESEKPQGANLVAVLARIAAVTHAANAAHVESKCTMKAYMPETSKQRFVVERIKHWVEKGRKVIVYAKCPEVQERLSRILDQNHDLESVLFTGKQSIKKRSIALDDKFRFGDTSILLASMVANRGLNLEQASVVIFYDRGWSAVSEQQAISRTLRPSQRQTVQVERCHLKGSIDEYADQMIRWKLKAASAGLDFGEQYGEEEEYVHMDTILRQFCDDIECIASVA